jgi:hypothetical protein
LTTHTQQSHDADMHTHSELIILLHSRFENNKNRHPGIAWTDVQAKLEAYHTKLESLSQMEATGGEPDVVEYDPDTNTYLFFDCSAQSPAGRRSICYDRDAHESRKEFKPKNTALDMAAQMHIALLTQDQYRQLQTLGEFDTKTSSWIQTPANIRTLGGAIFADRRFDTVFVYHNGAESYYAGRGFRGSLRV